MRDPKSILVTGGAGFIGSNFLSFIQKDKSIFNPRRVVVLDDLTYAGNLENIQDLIDHQTIDFVKGNILSKDLVNHLFETYQFDAVINFAAESHVDNSINGSREFINTNIVGTHNLLECSRLHHLKKKDFCFLQISTDEVYGQLGPQGHFTEESSLKPRSPYSASKASSDLLVSAWNSTYNLPILITRCSNNYGPKQHKEKFIPVVISNALQGKKIPVYGNGKNVRDWIHVDDHSLGIALTLKQGSIGEVYCFGGDTELSNIDLAHSICKQLDEIRPRASDVSYSSQIEFVEDRKGHDFRYAIDSSKARKELGFQQRVTFNQGLKETISWYERLLR